MTHREGEEPSAFATELEILAVRGFGDIGPQARTRKVRDRFISEQQSCGLRRHLYSAPPDTTIREIVDRFRVWESHSEQGRGLMCTGVRWRWLVIPGSPRFFTEDPLMTVASPEVELQIPVSVARVVVGGSASARDLRPEPGNYSGLPREPGVSPENGNVLTQFFLSRGAVPSGCASHMCCSTTESGRGERTSGC